LFCSFPLTSSGILRSSPSLHWPLLSSSRQTPLLLSTPLFYLSFSFLLFLFFIPCSPVRVALLCSLSWPVNSVNGSVKAHSHTHTHMHTHTHTHTHSTFCFSLSNRK